ncbi:MFS transporter [Flexivirga sp. ID2601S]|uniref:MFS transporter n=1 Tax=Flexivirga aerilata TaxID=1656889 RepID=A0A849ABU3_9MICO|nr:MFS transporter [Flexivirga aerilata]NNG37995.1 MFS transporter [Flexivirga aerilata]
MTPPTKEGSHSLPSVVESPSADWPLGGKRAWAVWLSALSIYILAIFHRTSLGVAGVIAADRFHISSAQLATFVMVQLLVYAVMQVPVGALLDKYGSKVLLVAGVTTMSIAQFGFAFADSFALGVLARVFVGMGDAMVFVSLLRLVALWFPPARTPLMTQLCGVFGQLGAILAAGPLAVALHDLGWTQSYLIASLTGVVLGVILVLVVRDSPYRSKQRTDVKLRAVGRAVSVAWKEPGTRLGLWCHFTSQFSATVFSLMWGFPFLTKGEGLSTGTASLLLEIMVVATIAASPVFGVFTARYPYSRSTLVLITVGAIIAAWTIVLLWPGRAPLWMLIILVVITAVGGPGSMIGFDLARTFNPEHRLGSASGIVNVGGFSATLISVLLIGVVLDHQVPGGPNDYNLSAFRVAMCVQYFVWALGIVQIVRLRRETRRLVRADDDYAHLRTGLPIGRHSPSRRKAH